MGSARLNKVALTLGVTESIYCIVENWCEFKYRWVNSRTCVSNEIKSECYVLQDNCIIWKWLFRHTRLQEQRWNRFNGWVAQAVWFHTSRYHILHKKTPATQWRAILVFIQNDLTKTVICYQTAVSHANCCSTVLQVSSFIISLIMKGKVQPFAVESHY